MGIYNSIIIDDDEELFELVAEVNREEQEKVSNEGRYFPFVFDRKDSNDFNFSRRFIEYIVKMPVGIKERSRYSIDPEIEYEYCVLGMVLAGVYPKGRCDPIYQRYSDVACYEARIMENEKRLFHALHLYGRFYPDRVKHKDWEWWCYLCEFSRLERRVSGLEELNENSVLYQLYEVANPLLVVEGIAKETANDISDFKAFLEQYEKEKLPERTYSEETKTPKLIFLENLSLPKSRETKRKKKSLSKTKRPLKNKTVIEIDGESRTITEWLKKYNITVACYNSRLQKGLTPTEAIKKESRLYYCKMNEVVEIDGKSKTVEEWLEHFNINRQTVIKRIKEQDMTLVDALKTEKYSIRKKSPQKIEINGETKTIDEWCDRIGITRGCYQNRISKMGMSPKQALTTKKYLTPKK